MGDCRLTNHLKILSQSVVPSEIGHTLLFFKTKHFRIAYLLTQGSQDNSLESLSLDLLLETAEVKLPLLPFSVHCYFEIIWIHEIVYDADNCPHCSSIGTQTNKKPNNSAPTFLSTKLRKSMSGGWFHETLHPGKLSYTCESNRQIYYRARLQQW